MIYRSNCAKNSFKRFQIGCIVYRQFSMSLAFESTSGQWARSAKDWTTTFCEGGVDVVGVVTPLRGGAQVVLHGDQVVELSVLLGVHEEGEVEEDGEGQVEVDREEREVKEKRTWMTMRMG